METESSVSVDRSGLPNDTAAALHGRDSLNRPRPLDYVAEARILAMTRIASIQRPHALDPEADGWRRAIWAPFT